MGTFKNPDVWKQNLAYQIDDFVLYNGTVYMAIKPVPAGTEMSADYWTDFSGDGGDSGGETYSVSVYELIDNAPVPSEIKLYVMEWVPAANSWQPTATEALEVTAGTVIGLGAGGAFYTIFGVAESLEDDAPIYLMSEKRHSEFSDAGFGRMRNSAQ